jgi:signal transduction histidine kinase
MKTPPLPANEVDRLKALRDYQILDTDDEAEFDDLTSLAAYICNAPVALISLIDSNRQWLKSKFGTEITQTPREVAFCAHAILEPENTLVVPNALTDQRFADNPLVQSAPNIRFYAGSPLVTDQGLALGTLCVIDTVPRVLTPEQIKALESLRRQVMTQMELKINLVKLEKNIIQREQADQQLRRSNTFLVNTLTELKRTQANLIHTEKMSSLGQMIAGIAHEINNPISFIHGNLYHVSKNVQDLLELVSLYQKYYPQPEAEIEDKAENMDFSFLSVDLIQLLNSMKVGTERIQEIVLSLRNFSRLDEAGKKLVNIHTGIDNTLLILQHRLEAKETHPGIKVMKQYGQIPLVNCYPGHLNQVFMNILTNAIDTLEESLIQKLPQKSEPTIRICTELSALGYVVISIYDNGMGIPEAIHQNIFDPFFTTKSVGKGVGLGLSISHEIIVEKHGGVLQCLSHQGEGTEFRIEIPCQRRNPQ